MNKFVPNYKKGYLLKVQFHVQMGPFPLILQKKNGKMRREAPKMENSEAEEKKREAPVAGSK